jgi:hypothetical protein
LIQKSADFNGILRVYYRRRPGRVRAGIKKYSFEKFRSTVIAYNFINDENEFII